jgi:molybdopterin synthase sulfur carrier subunit
MPRVFLPPLVQELAGGTKEVEVDGTTIRQVIAHLEARFAGIRESLCSGDDLKPGLVVSVDHQVSHLGMWQPVRPTSEIHFLPAIGGG